MKGREECNESSAEEPEMVVGGGFGGTERKEKVRGFPATELVIKLGAGYI